MELKSNCCDARPTTEVFYEKGKTLGDCSECHRGAVFYEECYACATQRGSCNHDGDDVFMQINVMFAERIEMLKSKSEKQRGK